MIIQTNPDTAWLEEMLAYAANLLAQCGDIIPVDEQPSTGPAGDPDKFGISELLDEINSRRPEY